MDKELKVAIVHDWFTVNGGAEKVCKEIVNCYPDADIYSLIDFLSQEDRNIILNGKKSNTSIIQRFPFAQKLYRYYLPWFPYAIEQLNLSSYDLIISSSYAVAKGILVNSNQLHICYCHSPMRYLWDLYFDYVPKTTWRNFIPNYFIRKYLSKLRVWDVVSSNRVDVFIANSNNIAQRIKKIYRREAEVIYPPMSTERFHLVNEKEDYFVSACRLVPYKKVDLIVKAFKLLPDKRLKIVGSGPEISHIKKLAKGCPNIEVLGYVESDNLPVIVGKARGFINASFEDFGIAPVEAQACGTPVIAYGRGGVLETTIKDKTAVYFNEQSAEAIAAAVEQIEHTPLWSPKEISEFASTFNNERFRTALTKIVDRCL